MKESRVGRPRVLGWALLVALGVSLAAASAASSASNPGSLVRGSAGKAKGAAGLTTHARVTGVQHHTLLPPARPGAVLYDQMDQPAGTPGGVTSQDFEPSFDAFDTFTADDFVVPNGQTWNVTGVDVAGEYTAGGGPADSLNVIFYDNSGSNLPGNIVASRPGNSYTGGANAVITLTSPVSLGQGTYWVAVQSRQDFTPFGQWFWDNRLVSASQGAAWQNPGDGFGTGCTTYTNKITCLDASQNGPDQLFRINGTTGGGGPSCSGGAITINDDGPATPYPSTCVVSGHERFDLGHQRPADRAQSHVPGRHRHAARRA